MNCTKELKFTEKCPFEELYVKNSMHLPIDEQGKCIFHSEETNWKKENNFSEELQKYISFANNDKDLDTIFFNSCVFVSDTPGKYGSIIIEGLKFLKYVDFSNTSFPTSTTFKNNHFRKGFYASGMKTDSLWFSNNHFYGIQIASSHFSNDFTFSNNIIDDVVSFLNTTCIGATTFNENDFIGHLSFRRVNFFVKNMTKKK